jgi:hypothetical protein
MKQTYILSVALLITSSLLISCNRTPIKSDVSAGKLATSTATQSACASAKNFTKEDVDFFDSPLNYVVFGGNLQEAECLLKSGVSPNTRNQFGETMLKVAITRNNPDMVALLLKYRATANLHTTSLTTPDGCGNEKPMDVAREVGNSQIIALLKGAETAGECTNRPLEEMKLMESFDPMRNPRLYE